MIVGAEEVVQLTGTGIVIGNAIGAVTVKGLMREVVEEAGMDQECRIGGQTVSGMEEMVAETDTVIGAGLVPLLDMAIGGLPEVQFDHSSGFRIYISELWK